MPMPSELSLTTAGTLTEDCAMEFDLRGGVWVDLTLGDQQFVLEMDAPALAKLTAVCARALADMRARAATGTAGTAAGTTAGTTAGTAAGTG